MLTGEPLALDLMNTRAVVLGEEVDALSTEELFREWLVAQTERTTTPSGPLSADFLAAVRELRRHIEAAVHAARHDRKPPPQAIDAINEAAKGAPKHEVLTASVSELISQTHRIGDDHARLLAELAESAIDLLTSSRVRNVRNCEGHGCRMVFVPAHPRRRWCSADLCGNRARVARYYRRHNKSQDPVE